MKKILLSNSRNSKWLSLSANKKTDRFKKEKEAQIESYKNLLDQHKQK
jgi:hypothetical protein